MPSTFTSVHTQLVIKFTYWNELIIGNSYIMYLIDEDNCKW